MSTLCFYNCNTVNSRDNTDCFLNCKIYKKALSELSSNFFQNKARLYISDTLYYINDFAQYYSEVLIHQNAVREEIRPTGIKLSSFTKTSPKGNFRCLANSNEYKILNRTDTIVKIISNHKNAYLTISNVGFNSNMSLATLIILYRTSNGHLIKHLFFLEHENDEWNVLKHIHFI